MRKIILDLAVSLDGFIEGPDKEIDWCIMDEKMQFDQFIDSIDTIFYGRVSYDSWGNYQPNTTATAAERQLWAGIHDKKKYVFSRQSNSEKEENNATFINADISQKVQEIKNQSGSNIWLYGGASLIKTFIQLSNRHFSNIAASGRVGWWHPPI